MGNLHKLSPYLLEQLSGIDRDRKVRVLVQLKQDFDAQTVAGVDRELAKFGSHRLSEPNLFRYVLLEATRDAILALDSSPSIDAVIDNAPLVKL